MRLPAAAAVLLALTGCINSTPLPLSPLQVIVAGWPAKSETPATIPRNYTIRGDTFTVNSNGLQVVRPNQRDWEFQAISGGVAVLLRQGPGGTVPRPSVQVTVVPIPPGTDVAQALLGDQAAILQSGGGLTAMQIGVDGIQGESWIITQPDPNTKLSVRFWRVYILHEGQLTLIQAQAEPNTFLQLLPQFEQMLAFIRVPASPNKPAEGEVTPRRVDVVRFDEVTVPGFNLTIKPVDPRLYLASSLAGTTTIERRELPKDATERPKLTVTTITLNPGTDAAKAIAEEKAKIEQVAKIETSQATVDGKAGEAWVWTETPQGATVGTTHKRVTVIDGSDVSLLEYTADAKNFDGVKAEFEALLAGVKLPKPQPAQQPAAK